MDEANRTLLIADELEVTFTSEVMDGEIMDTQVSIGSTGDEAICWIAGSTIDAFANEFKALIEKYRI